MKHIVKVTKSILKNAFLLFKITKSIADET